MSKILRFPDEKGGDDGVRITKEFCQSCGGGLDLWSGDDGVAYGVCTYCDFEVGKQPIILVQGSD
jgi:ribosomal protein S27AE